jgi:hypothetical protein
MRWLEIVTWSMDRKTVYVRYAAITDAGRPAPCGSKTYEGKSTISVGKTSTEATEEARESAQALLPKT